MDLERSGKFGLRGAKRRVARLDPSHCGSAHSVADAVLLGAEPEPYAVDLDSICCQPVRHRAASLDAVGKLVKACLNIACRWQSRKEPPNNKAVEPKRAFQGGR